VLHFGLGWSGLKMAPTVASTSIMLQAYAPIAALLAWVIYGEALSPGTGVAVALGFFGVLVLGFDPQAFDRPLAVGLVAASAFFLGLGSTLMRYLKDVDVFNLQGWSAWIAIGPLCALGALTEEGWAAQAAAASPMTWFGVVNAALAVSLVGHGLYYVLLRRHPVATVTPPLLATPVVASALGVLFLGDRLSVRFAIGGAMVLGAALLILRKR
jgi:O-acetylserine/cysteine efflux transporter